MRLAIFALVAFAATLVAGESISERQGYLYQHRKRLGHFKEQPFIDLYKAYAAAFVLPLHKDRSHDDYRSFTPSGEECVVFFQQFRVNKYKVNQIEDLILLDACLGYLYESEYHELDKSESEMLSKKLAPLLDDENLKSLYEGTKINELSDDGKTCVSNLLMSSVMMRKQYKEVRCNSNWIQLFLQFAACHKSIGGDYRHDDSYIKSIYEIVRDETHVCFDAEKLALEEATRNYYKRAYARRARNKIAGAFRKNLDSQQADRMWPTAVQHLLRVVQGAKKEVSLRQVHQLLRGYYLNDPKLKQMFLNNIADYAKSVITLKTKDKKGDPTGRQRYEDVVNGLCNFFRSADNENGYDFATSFIRLVRILNHEDVFGISFKEFIEKVLTHSQDTASMYLSISACNILTYTQGFIRNLVACKFGQTLSRDCKIEFVVEPAPNSMDMVRWPDAGYY